MDLNCINKEKKSSEILDSNWCSLQNSLLELLVYKISTSDMDWYVDGYSNFFSRVENLKLNHPQQVDLIPQGLLAEVFFMNACEQSGFECCPSVGNEDAKGVDFVLSKYGFTKYVDVTLNFSKSSLRRKTKEWRVPTLFLPWRIHHTKKHITSYAQEYLATGRFDGKEYLDSVVTINYSFLDGLRRNVWRGENVVRNILRKQFTDFSGSGFQYVKNLENTLLLIREGIN